VLTSLVVLLELQQTRDEELRRQSRRLYRLTRKRNVPTSARVKEIADDLQRLGAIGPAHVADALHLGYALIGQADALVTWNLADLARPHTRQIVSDYCWRRGLAEMRIGDPIEVGRWLDVRIE
jgi:hypothetical protein